MHYPFQAPGRGASNSGFQIVFLILRPSLPHYLNSEPPLPAVTHRSRQRRGPGTSSSCNTLFGFGSVWEAARRDNYRVTQERQTGFCAAQSQIYYVMFTPFPDYLDYFEPIKGTDPHSSLSKNVAIPRKYRFDGISYFPKLFFFLGIISSLGQGSAIEY